jgi:hypothetical protein
MAPGAARETGIRTPAAHILTPETENSTHYYWISPATSTSTMTS